MSKHTHGPWKAKLVASGVWVIDSEDGTAWIARTTPMLDIATGMALSDTEYDARLIAAAPCMLEALSKFQEYESAAEKGNDLQMMLSYAEFSKMAKAAFAKATGGSK